VNAEISKCPGYCCSLDRKATEGEIKHYRKNIEAIISVLSGKRNAIITELKHEMKEASKSQAYERAAKARDQIYGLESMYRHRGIALKRRGEVPYHKIERVLNTLFNAHRIKRVEGYDISNISGADSTGSMVVFSDGRPDKSQYRKFKVKTIEGPNDVGSQKEVLRRRLTHEEWQFPDLVLIDGGLPQLRAVATILTTPRAREIKLGALAKPPRRFFSRAPSGPGQNEDLLHILGRAKPVAVKSLPQDVRHFLQRVRDESHRFAKSYHSLLRKKSFAASR
jgi:excinuclease ABC subunit C